MTVKKMNRNPGNTGDRINKLIVGIQSKIPATDSLDVLGALTKPSDVLAGLNTRNTPYVVADGAHTALTAAVKVRDEAEADTLRYVEAVESGIKAHLGDTNPDLISFGITPKRAPRALTADEKAQKVAALRATRAARKAALVKPTQPPKV